MGKLLDLIPKIEEGLFVDSVEKQVYERNGWALRRELGGEGEATALPLLMLREKRTSGPP